MTAENDIVLKVENLGKLYQLGQFGTGTISHDLNRWWAGITGKEDPFSKVGSVNDRTQKAKKREKVWAVKDINFEVKRGEVLGIIGKNGAGKSTLLKLISNITLPTTGSIKAKGRIASLLEVGTGMHPEMTGRENVYLNGTILGMTRREINAKFDDIMDFAGCAKYADTPVKRYSSGMKVRLGFAVAAFLEPEILIVDEVLAVGDAEFQKKAIGKMKDVSKEEGRTVLFVSHNMAAVKSLCTKSLVLVNGEVGANGEVSDAVLFYQQSSMVNRNLSWNCSDAPGNDKIRINEVRIETPEDKLLDIASGFFIKLFLRSYIEGANIDCTIELVNQDEVIVCHVGSIITNNKDSVKGVYIVRCEIPKNFLNAGIYRLNVIIGENQRFLIYKADEIFSFEIENTNRGISMNKKPGVVRPVLNWDIKKPGNG